MSAFTLSAVLTTMACIYIVLAWRRPEVGSETSAFLYVLMLLVAGSSVIPLVTDLGNIVVAAAYGIACIGLLLHITGRGASSGWSFLIFVLPAYLFLVDLASNGIGSVSLGGHLGAFLFAGTVVLFNRAGGVPFGAAFFSIMSMIAVGLVAGLARGIVARSCDLDKCTPLGFLVTGGFVSENSPAALGGFLLVLVIAYWRGLRRDVRWSAAVFLVLLMFATGARTPLLATVAGGAWVAFSRFSGLSAGFATKLFSFVLLVVGGLSLGLLLRADPEDFSNRGRTWLGVEAVLDVREAWAFGVGASSWDYYQTEGFLSMHFAHSVYVLLLFSGGLFALLLYLALLAVYASRSIRLFGSVSAGPHVYMVVLGLMEVAWNPSSLDGLSILMLCTLAFRPVAAGGSSRLRRGQGRDEPGGVGPGVRGRTP